MQEKENIYQIMGEKGASLLKEEVLLLEDLKKILASLTLEKNEVGALENILAHMEELFLLVVVGEVKAGKSAFVNTLLGKKICKEGVTPVTDKINILRYGKEEKIKGSESFVIEKEYPFEPLRNINIVDTPGTNSLILEHQQITEKFVPRSDLVLFITSIDRPFTESERKFLQFIKDLWGKKIIFILSKIDLKEESEVEEVLSFIRENCKKLLSFEPLIFPVSAKLAWEGKTKNDPALWEKSRFGALEEYVFKVLSEQERLKLKLSGPLFNALKIIERIFLALQESQGASELDREVIAEIQKIMGYEERMLKQNYFTDIEKTKHPFHDLENWGKNFLARNLQWKELLLFVQKKKLAGPVDDDKLKPLARMLTQTQEKAHTKLLQDCQNVANQTFEALEKKFKNPLCRGLYKSTERDISKKASEEAFSSMNAFFQSKMDAKTLVSESQALLRQSQKKAAVWSIGFLILGFFGLIFTMVGSSVLLHLLGYGFLGTTLWAVFRFIPQQKEESERRFHEFVEGLREETRVEQERAYQKLQQSFFQPLQEAVRKRQSILDNEKKNHLDQKKQLESFQAKARDFQKKLDSL